MPNIPELKVGSTTYDLHDKRVDDLKNDLPHYLSCSSDDAIVIPANSDLNDYTTPGRYKIMTVATSETISNIPYATSGTLIVSNTTQADRYIQIYWVNSDHLMVYFRYYQGSWRDWVRFADKGSVEGVTSKNRLTTGRDVYPATSNEIVFEHQGTNILLTFPRSIVHYLAGEGSMIEKQISNGTTITVPHDSFAIYNIDSTAVEVKTLDELRSLTGVNYIVLFYNSSGNVHGMFEKYSIQQKINKEADVYFYGIYTFPVFSLLGDYSIDVTIPANARVNFLDLTANPETFKNGISTNITAQTINVPHDKCLVYDLNTKLISVENYVFDFDRNKAVLFYNSHGIVNGPWYRYYLLQRINEEKDGYPAYFKDQLTTRIDTVNTMLTAVGSSGIVFITDHHYPNNDMKSVGIVKTVCKQTGINKVFLGGDYINRETLKAKALRNINRVAGQYSYPGAKTFRICGNHEFNNPGASSDPDIVANELNATELRNAILNTFVEEVVCDENSLSYYYDDKTNKIRYIVGSVTRSSSLDAASVKWVCDQLLLVPENYSVIVMFHTILSYQNGTSAPVNSASNLIKTLDAFKNKASYTFGGTTYDFSGSEAELICAICADMHVDTDYTTEGGVHIIATTTDSMQELGGLTREVGTVTEVAFDVFVFNTVQKTINCIRIGAGSNRSFTY